MKKNIAFGITLIRGFLAILLGSILLLQPDKTRVMLGNFMGLFWLTSGIVSLRWGVSGKRARVWSILAGVIGVMAGIGFLSRGFATEWVAEELLFSVVGGIVLLTGIFHIFGGFRVGDHQQRKWSITSFLLGIFEAVLGIMLIVEPMRRAQNEADGKIA
jgi:uncharacterized membrane protein HdeD (DUF308 family)